MAELLRHQLAQRTSWGREAAPVRKLTGRSAAGGNTLAARGGSGVQFRGARNQGRTSLERPPRARMVCTLSGVRQEAFRRAERLNPDAYGKTEADAGWWSPSCGIKGPPARASGACRGHRAPDHAAGARCGGRARVDWLMAGLAGLQAPSFLATRAHNRAYACRRPATLAVPGEKTPTSEPPLRCRRALTASARASVFCTHGARLGVPPAVRRRQSGSEHSRRCRNYLGEPRPTPLEAEGFGLQRQSPPPPHALHSTRSYAPAPLVKTSAICQRPRDQP